MYHAIAVKELRETWWIGLLVAAVLMLNVLGAIGFTIDERIPFIVWRDGRYPGWQPPIPFYSGDWALLVLLVGGIGAVLLGLWQTLGESVQGTWVFYLHRPAGRRRLIVAKAVVGTGLLLFSLGLPLLLYALWAATPGTHASPFEWWMTGPTALAWAYASVAYLAAFLCGLRPARWWASRWFPAVPACCLWLPIAIAPWSASPMWLVIAVADAVLLGGIVFAGDERDYP